MSADRTRRAKAPRPGWTLDSGEAQAVLTMARKAFFVMVGILALLWAIQVLNFIDHYHLNPTYGIKPRDVASLPDILTAPFLHVSWTHIEGNSGPLFIFGFLAAYRGLAKFAAVTAIVVVTSGLAAWFFEAAGTYGVGASGVVFGYLGYILVRGLFDRRGIDVLIGAVMALCFAYQFTVLLPHQGIGWQAHIGGLTGGIVSGWLLRDRRAARAARATRAAGAARPVSPAATSAGTAIATADPAGLGGQVQPTRTSTVKQSGQPGGKKFTVDPTNPRADLYKQLDDMGL
ncbi:MAG TPA: rhomboid family intramembrane serine protease [Streptosporangiaceae bacterium]|nr:rhomboid family intramembrane serine protease [Streptosporangiaceae bacterium]